MSIAFEIFFRKKCVFVYLHKYNYSFIAILPIKTYGGINIMFNISQTIRKVMIDKGQTVSDIVKKSGILQSTLSRSLQKADNDYRINYLNQIVQALNCNIRIQIIDNDTQEVLYNIVDSEWRYTIII